MKLLTCQYFPRPLRIVVALSSFRAVSLVMELSYVRINSIQFPAANHTSLCHHRTCKQNKRKLNIITTLSISNHQQHFSLCAQPGDGFYSRNMSLMITYR
jgi:hypothetical protein